MSTNNVLRYPDTTPGMSIGDFKKWTVSQLKEFLGDRGINRDGLKEKLVINAYSAYALDLPAENVDPQIVERQVMHDYKKKLGWLSMEVGGGKTRWENKSYKLGRLLHINKLYLK